MELCTIFNLSTIEKGLLDELWSKLISLNFHLPSSKVKAFSAQAEASLSSDDTIETRSESDASSARSHGSGLVPHGGFPPHSPAQFFGQMPPHWIPSPNMQHMPPMMPPMQPGPHFIPMMPQWPHAPSMVNGSQASSSSVDQQSTVSEISSTSSDAVESGASSKASGNSPNSSFPAGNYGV